MRIILTLFLALILFGSAFALEHPYSMNPKNPDLNSGKYGQGQANTPTAYTNTPTIKSINSLNWVYPSNNNITINSDGNISISLDKINSIITIGLAKDLNTLIPAINYWDTNQNQTGLNGNKYGFFDLVTTGVIQAGYYYSNVGTGTPPFIVSSTDRVANLNADMVDGMHAIDFNNFHDTNWETSYPVFDSNMALRYVKQSDGNIWYAKTSDINSTFLRNADVNLVYVRQSDGNAWYAKISDVNGTYLKIKDLNTQYYTQLDANSVFLKLTGGTMTGDINMNRKSITGVRSIYADASGLPFPNQEFIIFNPQDEITLKSTQYLTFKNSDTNVIYTQFNAGSILTNGDLTVGNIYPTVAGDALYDIGILSNGDEAPQRFRNLVLSNDINAQGKIILGTALPNGVTNGDINISGKYYGNGSALTSVAMNYSDLNKNFVPYRGATIDVNLNNKDLNAKIIQANSFKSTRAKRTPLGTDAIALGYNTTASGSQSFAMGDTTTANSNYSTALGNNTISGGGGSLATGLATAENLIIASGIGSIASGEANGGSILANGDGSLALGYSSAVILSGKIETTNLGSIAIGSVNSNSSNATLSSAGVGSIAGGFASDGALFATGNGAIALGYSDSNMVSLGIGSVALGYNSKALQNYSTAIGWQATSAKANLVTLSQDVNVAGFLTIGNGKDMNTGLAVGDLNISGRLFIQKDANVSGNLKVQNDLNISKGTDKGVSITSDSNRICFPANRCDAYIDWNGTAMVLNG